MSNEMIFFDMGGCSAMSTHVGAMILGRFIVGLGLGLAGPVTAMYVSEVKLSPNCIAGQLSTCC
jgi:MFS family permease